MAEVVVVTLSEWRDHVSAVEVDYGVDDRRLRM
jgi:hypothetical protein